MSLWSLLGLGGSFHRGGSESKVEATGGQSNTYGAYKAHRFNDPGNFVVTNPGKIDFIVVGGGGAGVNIDVEQGNVWYYSTNETTTATPNIRWNGSVALDD